MSRIHIYFLMCGAVVGSFFVKGQEKVKIADLRGTWKFSIGHGKDWAKIDFNDSGWDNVFVPSKWEDQGFYGYDGYAFYRKKVKISSQYDGYTFNLELGYIDDVDEVYFNGVMIGSKGSFPPNYSTAYNAKREYYIPENVIKYDQANLIAVKVYDAEQGGGIVSGDQRIYVSGPPVNFDINLLGKWKFKTGDNFKYKDIDYNDGPWDKIFVPAFWEDQGYRDYDGYAWYRISFYYKKNIPDETLVIMLGNIDDIDQVYINGKLVGSTGNFEKVHDNSSTYQALRGYYFPEKILKVGQVNTVAVRVYDGQGGGGIYKGPVGILSQTKYIKYWRNRKKDLYY